MFLFLPSPIADITNQSQGSSLLSSGMTLTSFARQRLRALGSKDQWIGVGIQGDTFLLSLQ